MQTLSQEQIVAIKKFQQSEISEHYIYKKLARVVKDENNAQVLSKIGDEEKKHYEVLKNYTHAEVRPKKSRVFWYYLISRIFGITFGIKLMEKGEGKAQKAYEEYITYIPELKSIIDDEDKHEQELIALIDEERLKYVGSMVLGLNDALVELTGTLAGLSFALQNTKLIAMAGLITGIAAALSMASSDYLAQKADNAEKSALKSSAYTGVAYIVTVALLIAPYLIFSNYITCLMLTLSITILIIFGFNYYISVAKDLNFKQRFAEMALISLSVAALSFGIGILIKKALGVDV